MVKITLAAALFVIVFNATAFSQHTVIGKVSGKVYLENNKAAVKATISLLNQKDSATVKLSVPDDNGVFLFEDLKEGEYFIAVTYAGYKKYVSIPFKISEQEENITLPNIVLEPGNNTLAEVKLESKKPFIERKIDRLIVNVENSIVSTGSTALEVLERSPGVIVNEEIGINLKGKSGVTIMLDGKVTPLSGTDLVTYLKSIPSANIERIEIITNPSAKYDAEGNAGIIDIRFKKNKQEGYNGSLGLSVGQGVYSKPSVNGSVNYRRKKWNLFSNAAYSAPDNFSKFFINRKFFTGGNGPLESVFDQNTFTRQPQHFENIKAGVDYYASKKTVIGAMLNGTLYNGERNGLSDAIVTHPDGSLEYTNQTANLLHDKRYNLFGNFNYKHTFDSAERN